MPKYKVRRSRVVWETEEFQVEAASPEDVRARFPELYDEASEGNVQFSSGDSAGDHPEEVEVFAGDDPHAYKVLLKFDPDVPAGRCEHELEQPVVLIPDDVVCGMLPVRCKKCGEFGDCRKLTLTPRDAEWPETPL